MFRDALGLNQEASKTTTTCRSSSVRIAIASSPERSISRVIFARTPKKSHSNARSVAGRLFESKNFFCETVGVSLSLTCVRDSLIRHKKSHTAGGMGRRRRASELLTDLQGGAATRNSQAYSGASPPGTSDRNSASCTSPSPAHASAPQFWDGQGQQPPGLTECRVDD